MIRSALSVAVLAFCLPCLAEETLLKDWKALSDSHGLHWKSDILDVKFADGSEGQRILVLEFVPPSKERPDIVKVRLSLATPVEGDAQASGSGSIGGGLHDVRLEEQDGVRTMTIARSIETVEKPNAKTQRILDKFAISFTYELKGDSLTLKGFSIDKPTRWGPTEFTVAQKDITFKTGR